MLKEQLLPIAIEFTPLEYFREMRVVAAANEQQAENLQARLQSGVIKRFGKDFPLTPRQRLRRERHLWDLKVRVEEDVISINIAFGVPHRKKIEK